MDGLPSDKPADLTAQAEQRDNISKELNSITDIKERLSIAREMLKINEADRKADPNVPEMELSILQNGKGGEQHLAAIEMKPTAELTNPSTWPNVFKGSTEVYSMPKSEMTSAEFADGIAQAFGADNHVIEEKEH